MFAVVVPKADVCFLCSRAGRGSLLSDSVDQPSLHRNLPEVLVPGPVPGGSDVIVLVEAWAWCVFKAPTQFRFLAEVENHRSRAGPAEGRACTVCVCVHVCTCVSQMPSLCISPSSPIWGHPSQKPAIRILCKSPDSFPNVPRAPPASPRFTLYWSLPASDFLFPLSTPSPSCLPP